MKLPIDNGVVGLALLLAAASVPAQQSATRPAEPVEYPPVYRVEAVVFVHADGRSDRMRSSRPMDFTDRLDPLLVARANDVAERELARLASALPVARLPGELDETTPRLVNDEQTLRPIPPVYSALGDLSNSIRRAMDRLLDAPDYEPLAARAWIQLAQRGRRTAAVRIHDQTVVDLLEPDAARSLVPVPPVLPFGPLVETPPPALDIYRLDGTLVLRQRQFLHLDLDLVWQTRARALTDRATPAQDAAASAGDEQAAQGEWQLHRMQQSRIVQPGRLEYFDSSLFGVLVRIERFEQVVPKIEEPEPTPTELNPPQTVDPVTNSGR